MKIGNKLRQIIKSKYKNDVMFSQKIGMSSSSVSQFLTNKRRPSMQFLEHFIREFPEVDLNWLLKNDLDINNKEDDFLMEYQTPLNENQIIINIELLLSELKDKIRG